MKNPMKQPAVAAPQRLQPPAPIVRKSAEKLPSSNDFFEEMGFGATKPKLGAETARRPAATGLGATSLSAVGSEDLGGGDEWDDSDLDDLLDD